MEYRQFGQNGIAVSAIGFGCWEKLALRRTLSQPAIATGLVGFRRPDEVSENLGAPGFEITDQDMAAIDAIFARNDVVTEPPGWLEDDPAV